MLLDLGLEVVEVDVAGDRVGLDDDDAQAGHHGAGGVGAVRAARDEAHGALVVAARAVVGGDRQQAGQLALRPGVRLQRHGVVAGDLAQPAAQLVDQAADAAGLLVRRERVHLGELGPGHRHHLGGRVELHRARAERDHAAVEGEVAVGEAAQVAQHRGLGVVGREHRVGEVVGGAHERLAPRGCCDAHPLGRHHAERLGHAAQVEQVGGLVDAELHGVVVDPPQVDPGGQGGVDDLAAPGRAPGRAACRTPGRRRPRARPRAARHAAPRRARAPPGRSRAAPPGRGRRHTCSPSRRAAPGRCRCWTSPSRAGCAARGSAGRAGRPAPRRRRPRPRRGARAWCARVPGARSCSRRAGHRTPSARRSAGWCRRRRRPPTPPAGSPG